MPETGIDSQTKAAMAAIFGNKSAYAFSDEGMDRVLKRFDNQRIGSGSECCVITINGESKKVVAFRYSELSPLEAKKTFYAQRIMSTLFPYNFPQFFASWASYNKEGVKHPAGTVRQTIVGKEPEDFWNDAYYPSGRVNHDLARVDEISEQLNLPTGLDLNSFNFAVDEKRDTYYLDKVRLDDEAVFDLKKITEYMDKNPKDKYGNPYTEADKKLVVASIQRLKDLGAAEIVP